MTEDERRAMRLSKCQHFTGIRHKTCEAGVCYAEVRDSSQPGPLRWPCLTLAGKAATTMCAKYEATTPEQLAEEDAEIEALVHRVVTNRANGLCIACSKPSTFEVVGPCEYARPCGHRQGNVNAGGE